jgi:protoheme ferro-lyase
LDFYNKNKDAWMEQNWGDKTRDWGVLLANLGTPETPDRQRWPFSACFLSDPRVVDLPWLWLPLLNW